MNDALSNQDTPIEPQWVESGANRARWRVDGVLQVVLGDAGHAEGATYAERDGREALDLVGNLVGGAVNVLNMTDIRRVKKTTARVLRLQSHPSTARLALLTGSPVSRMLGNAYLSITKLKHPTRLFTDEGSAVAWLLEGLDD
ncbi:MAG: hypothetical protein QF464_17920 [Myxococcota bacterium]|nr:hypothetical protein [Myxococcota bacterium]